MYFKLANSAPSIHHLHSFPSQNISTQSSHTTPFSHTIKVPIPNAICAYHNFKVLVDMSPHYLRSAIVRCQVCNWRSTQEYTRRQTSQSLGSRMRTSLVVQRFFDLMSWHCYRGISQLHPQTQAPGAPRVHIYSSSRHFPLQGTSMFTSRPDQGTSSVVPWVLPAQKRRTVLLRAVHQLNLSVQHSIIVPAC